MHRQLIPRATRERTTNSIKTKDLVIYSQDTKGGVFPPTESKGDGETHPNRNGEGGGGRSRRGATRGEFLPPGRRANREPPETKTPARPPQQANPAGREGVGRLKTASFLSLALSLSSLWGLEVSPSAERRVGLGQRGGG